MSPSPSHSDEVRQPVALVTGSGSARVGNQLVRSLADQGYAVGLHFRSSSDSAHRTVEALEHSGRCARAFAADVTQEADVDDLIDSVQQHFGRLDLLVTTASRWDRHRLEDVTAQHIQDAFAVDGLGTFLCARRAGLMMAAQPEGGSIVLMGDASSQQPRQDEAAYYMAKGTIPPMTRMLAVELAARNPAVRVNAVLPGSVMAPDGLTATELNKRRSETLTQTADNPQALLNTVLYLAKTPFVTGQCLTLDGGRGLKRDHVPHGLNL